MSLSGGHAWEPLQTCGACGYLYLGQLGVETFHPGMDTMFGEKRQLCRGKWSVGVSLPVTPAVSTLPSLASLHALRSMRLLAA